MLPWNLAAFSLCGSFKAFAVTDTDPFEVAGRGSDVGQDGRPQAFLYFPIRFSYSPNHDFSS